MRARVLATLAAVVVMLVGAVPGAGAEERELLRSDVSFEVSNLTELGATRTLHGFRIDPPCEAETAVLLLHGLSYTAEAWDFSPDFDHAYSYARIIAAAGYTVVAVDRLGYGRSELDDGRLITSPGHGEIAAQLESQLREEFAHVAIGGHSAGAETSIVAAGLFGAGDALIPMGYHQYPSVELLIEFFTGDVPNALLDDYVYFLGTPERRAEMFFTEHADPAVVEADTEAAVLTPSGEILTIGFQASRAMAALVTVPVYLQLADSDRLFEAGYADLAAALYLLAPSVSLDIVPDAGHTYMLHPTGPAAAERIAAWLRTLDSTPPCEPEPASEPAPEPTPDPDDDEPVAPPEPPLPATGGGVGAVLLLGLALFWSASAGARRPRSAR